MKSNIKIFIIVFVCLSLSQCRSSSEGIEYIKIFQTSNADSLNAYNKGMGLAGFIKYTLSNDSIIYRDAQYNEETEEINYSYFIGQAENNVIRDSLIAFLEYLKSFKEGILYDTTHDGDAGPCGAEYYVEYKDKKGLHPYLFILDGEEFSKAFNSYYGQFGTLQWKKVPAKHSVVNPDLEIVTAMKNLGTYDKTETPYIPLICGSGIDTSLIYGQWRYMGSHDSKIYIRKHNYNRLTFKRNGLFSFDRVGDDTIKKPKELIFKWGRKENSMVVFHTKGKTECEITQLTRNCLKLKYDDSVTMYYDRIPPP